MLYVGAICVCNTITIFARLFDSSAIRPMSNSKETQKCPFSYNDNAKIELPNNNNTLLTDVFVYSPIFNSYQIYLWTCSKEALTFFQNHHCHMKFLKNKEKLFYCRSFEAIFTRQIMKVNWDSELYFVLYCPSFFLSKIELWQIKNFFQR